MSAIEHVLSMLLNVLRSECTVIEYIECFTLCLVTQDMSNVVCSV